MAKEQVNDATALVGRRGLIAGAAALAAGILAKQTAQPVAAAYNFQGDAVNTASATTVLNGSIGGTLLQLVNSGSSSGATTLDAQATAAIAMRGVSLNNIAVDGTSATVIGVRGTFSSASASNGIGVQGVNNSSGTGSMGVQGVYNNSSGIGGIGVHGTTSSVGGAGVQGNATGANAAGVAGISTLSIGVDGEIPSASSANNTSAMLARNSSGGTNGVGILAICNPATGVAVKGQSVSGTSVAGISTNGTGIYGQSTSNVGISGFSTGSYGIVGITAAGGPFSGITGGATANGAAAFAGGTSNPNAYAAYFSGRTVVQGDFTVVGGQKNAAVQAADGSYRVLHCVEAPEPWFEDFGEGTLANGKAAVALDADFAAVVQTDRYHVFLTPYEGTGALRAVQRTPGGFAVEEIGGASGGGFSWRVVARRKDLGKVQRLAKFTLPNIKIPGVDDLPKVSVTPDPPPRAAAPNPVTNPSPPPRAAAPPAAPAGPQPDTPPPAPAGKASGASPEATSPPAPNPAPPPRP